MQRLLAIGLLSACVLVIARAGADEGPVAELSAPPVQGDRQSTYVGSRAGATEGENSAVASARKSERPARAHAHEKGRASENKTSRGASQVTSPWAPYFHIFDAGSQLITDRDADGYASEFRIRFDADTDLGNVWVYAMLYLRRYGETDWQLYRITDDFLIEGHSDNDDYFVTTVLDDGFATSEYDVLIDLYEADRPGIVATLHPFDSPALSLLPMEEVGLDVPIQIGGYSIEAVTTTLLTDGDGDDHFSRFRITFDPDADFTGAVAYVRVWIRGSGGEWFEEFVSEDFVVDPSGAGDAYSIEIDWVSGYPTSFYDVQIDMYDASTNLLAASAGSERPQLAQIPLEDRSRDRVISPPVTGGGGSTSSREHGGGGAMMGWWLGALAVVAWRRRRRQGFEAPQHRRLVSAFARPIPVARRANPSRRD